MSTLPGANVSISAEAGALAGGTGYCVVIAPVATNADTTPRVFSSASAIYAQHGYSQGMDYSDLHIEATKKPILFVGIPVATAGVASRQDTSGVTGNSAITVAAAASGYLEEVDAILTVSTGGTIGTTGIVFTISMDGGVTEKRVSLGTATSYPVPYLGIVISFAAGTLIAGDVYTFATTAPMWDSTGMAAAKTALAAQLKLSRSWMVIGDVPSSTVAGYVTTAVNGYQTANDRFTGARINVRDRTPLAEMARETVRMTGTPTITFAEVGGTGDTITRSAGSFIADGFSAGMVVTVAGAVATTGYNNITGKITAVSALVLTLDTADLIAEGPISGVSILGSNGLVFTTTTATRSGGSWLDDGFAVGDSVTFAGTASNNATFAITVLTATVMTFASGGVAETIGTRTATCVKGETMAAWVSAMDAAFAAVDAQKRINIGMGRLRKESPLTQWSFRRPVAWADSIRSYQHDLHVTTWKKESGPLDGWSMLDANGNVAEYDERVNGGALAGRFTCARTWSNGPNGSFIARSLTRDSEGAVLSQAHNREVANLACSVVQAATENIIGKTLVLNDDGTATTAALQVIEEAINTDLAEALMREHVPGDGQRASKAVWRASTDDVLSGPDATLTGVLDLQVNGTIVNVDTLVKVR